MNVVQPRLFTVALACAALAVLACGRPTPVAVGAEVAGEPSWIAQWERDAGGGATHAITLREDGRFGFQAWGPKLPISRAMGRWTRNGDVVRFQVEAHEPAERPFPYATEWKAARLAGGELKAQAGIQSVSWTVRGPAKDGGIWSVVPPDGVELMSGTVTLSGSSRPPIDVLAVNYFAGNHPYVDIETLDGHRMTLYEAPNTDRLIITVDAAFVDAAGVAGVVATEKYGSYVPLADIGVSATPPDGLRKLPLKSLQLTGVPVAKMSGPGSSRGDRPEDALVHIDLDLTFTKSAGMDKRAAGLVKIARPAP